MGAQSARRFGLGLGDSVFVRLSTVTGQQNVTEYNLGAVYDDTAAGGMSTVLVSLSNILADLNMKEGQYQSLAIILADASTADSVAKRLSAELPALGFSLRSPQGAAGPGAGGPGAAGPGAGGLGAASSNSAMKSGMGPRGDAQQAILMGRGMASGMTVYRLATVTELSGQMGAVLGSVRWIGATIFAIMLILTMAGITNTYRMVLMERTREIGMLRCIGFKRVDIFKIFVYEALFIAIAGSLAGILASLPMGLFIHAIRFDPSGALGSALSRGHLVFSPDGISFLIISLSVVLASTIAVFGPARRASRLLPAEALRTTA
jgi:putative ABC transport system permease protein